MNGIQWTDKPAAAGGRVVHALQGGGKGIPGRYIKNLTWCGVEKRSRICLAETSAPVTCKACLQLLKYFRENHGYR